jgi:3-oxocholest-4-en-26-oate---CoA ligase
VPEREALVCGNDRITYRELDLRATRLAHFLRDRGIRRGDHIGTYLYNGVDYVTTMLAAFKISAVPININYRYVEDELVYLFRNADLKALVHQREFAVRIAHVKDSCPDLRLFIHVGIDGSADALPVGGCSFAEALVAGAPERDFGGRSNDDLFIIYTGGTTGLPKGVMWAHEAAYFACFGGGNPIGEPIRDLGTLLARARTVGAMSVSLIAAPLIHGAAQLATVITLIGGGKAVYQRHFDADEMPRLIAENGVRGISLVGDAMARPLADALERNADAQRPYDCSSVLAIGSAGAIFSQAVKDKLKRLLPQCTMLDNYGSTETGFQGRGGAGHKSFGQGLVFHMNERTLVLDDNLQPVRPGSGVRGRVALRGHVPLGYYGDAQKTAETFVEIGGVRHVLTGDIAEVEADGTVKLFGRGSACINSGGEKIFAEEVENALKSHTAVYDAVVVGVEDPEWSQRVVALVSLAPGARDADEAALREHCRKHIAGYKVPKEVHVVDAVFRGPNGKVDYKLSLQTASELSHQRARAR